MYKNNQLWNRYFPRSQRISYRYRKTPRCPSIYFIDINKFLLLFLLTITKQKYFSSSPKLFFFLLHCFWIYPASCGLTSVLWELYCYDLLHLGVSKHLLNNILIHFSTNKIVYKYSKKRTQPHQSCMCKPMNHQYFIFWKVCITTNNWIFINF